VTYGLENNECEPNNLVSRYPDAMVTSLLTGDTKAASGSLIFNVRSEALFPTTYKPLGIIKTVAPQESYHLTWKAG